MQFFDPEEFFHIKWEKTFFNVQQIRNERGPFKYDVDFTDDGMKRVIKHFVNLDGTYEGEINSNTGEKDGKGYFIYANGDLYEGYWCKNKRNGKGRMIYSKMDKINPVFDFCQKQS